MDFNLVIDRYLKIIDQIGEPNESYKYDAINHFQKHWKIETDNFHKMFMESFRKRHNLFYQNSWGFISKAAVQFPEEVRAMFANLFDENNDLKFRIKEFQDASNSLLGKLKDTLGKSKLNAQQDERTISVYLAFRYPEKYLFYIFNWFKSFAEEFEIPMVTNENFLYLVNQLPKFRETVLNRTDLTEKYRELYPKPTWDDTNLLIQNVFYVAYRKDLEDLLTDSVSEELKKVLKKIGSDAVFFFEILDNLIEKFNLQENSEQYYFNYRKVGRLLFGVGQRYTWITEKNLFGFMSLDKTDFHKSDYLKKGIAEAFWNELKDFESNKNLIKSKLEAAFPFQLEKTEKSSFLEENKRDLQRMVFDKNFRNEVLERLGIIGRNYWLFQGNPNFYDFETALKENKIDNWTVSRYKDEIKEGDKIIIWLIGKNAGCYAIAEVTDNPKIKNESQDDHLWKTENKNSLKAGIKITHNLFNNPILKNEIESIPELINLKGGTQGTNFSSSKEEYEAILKIIENKNMNINQPLNQILFGPPGTGKTFNTINKAVSIINPEFDLSQDRRLIKAEYERLEKEGRIAFATFHQSMSYEDFIEGIKPEIDESDDGKKNVYYEVKDGLLKMQVKKALRKNISKEEILEEYSFDDAWNDLLNEANDNFEKNELLFLPLQTRGMGMKIIEISERGNLRLQPANSQTAGIYTVSYSRAKKLQGAYPDLSIVKNIDKQFREIIGGMNSSAYWSVVNYINAKIEGNSKKQQIEKILPPQPYVLIIDEINRGNVSQIFGELITLIEEDKRLGNKESLEIILPYSKEKFGVPPNLYIIGTMNTADRSVEALDTALRRRFSFEEMPPRYDLEELSYDIFGFKASEILETINKRIEKLVDKDHSIGHAYFIGKDENTIQDSFYRNIIPLLQEYFFGDFGKIGLVLGKGFMEVSNGNTDFLFADFSYENSSDYALSEVFQIIDYRKNSDTDGFKKAIQILMNYPVA